MTTSPALQTKIDAYLSTLRRSLGELPAEDVHDILREIRGHILERAEAAGELTEDRLVAILRSLGRPEELGPLYQTEALVERARVSLSPTLILKTTTRWAMRSLAGFGVFLVGLTGYGIAAGFVVSAILKPFFPANVGLWLGNMSLHIGYESGAHAGSRELLGWWLVPFGLVFGCALFFLTTLFLRRMLRLIRRPRQLPPSAWQGDGTRAATT